MSIVQSLHGTLRMALRALRRNVMRSVLTCLGIIIGIAAVIAMMEIGRGTAHSIEQTIASLGANVIQLDPADVMVSWETGTRPSGKTSSTGKTHWSKCLRICTVLSAVPRCFR